jgi:hypothetical protein
MTDGRRHNQESFEYLPMLGTREMMVRAFSDSIYKPIYTKV